MSHHSFKIEPSQRIQRLPPYLFGRINKMKYDKRVAGVDIIDLGMGNPTDPTPESVVKKLSEAARDPRNHRYSVSNGIAGLRREGTPVILYVNGGGDYLERMAETGADVLSLDWRVDIGEARRRIGHKVALQGNLDPCALYAPPEAIRAQVARVLNSFGKGEGHIFNLGHGILPDIPVAHAIAMVNAVHEESARFHGAS